MSLVVSIRCFSLAVTPITHARGTEGNELVINREPVVTPHGVRWVPVLSGNALRHRMVRAPMARWLVDRLGLAGSLNCRQLNFLFHGGALTESTARVDTAALAAAFEALPLLRLVGGSLPNAIVPGKLLVDRGVLVCRENLPRLASIMPDGLDVPPAVRPCEAFVDGWQYTRSESSRAQAELLDHANADDEDRGLMIYSGQSVIAGAVFVHGFHLRHGSEIDAGCLLLALSLWQQQGGHVGGMSARGHGRLDTLWHVAPDIDREALVSAYVRHVDEHADDARRLLADVFGSKSASTEAKKGRRSRATAAG